MEYWWEDQACYALGLAVLTNGREWRPYDVTGRGNLAGKHTQAMDIIKGNQGEAAKVLHYRLDKGRWR